MAVEIKSGNSTDLSTVDPTSKALRVTNYNSSGEEITDHVPVSVVVNPVTAINNDIIASFDVSQYSYISLQLTGTWVGAVECQASNDNGTFEKIVVQNTGDVLEPYANSLTSNGLFKIPVLAKYLRIRVTAFTSGIVEGTSFAYKEDVHTGQISSTGEVTIAASQSIGLSAGANQIGSVLITPNPTTMETDMYVGLPSDGAFNARSIKSTPTTLRSLTFTNLAATPRYLKIYDTSGVPTAGAGAPVILVSLPAAGTLAFPLPSEGFVFTNGIGMTMTLKPENSDLTNTATVDFSMVSVFHA